MKNVLILLIISSILLFSCKNSSENSVSQQKDEDAMPEKIGYSANLIAEIIYSVPNPLELSTLLHQSGVVYNADLLNPASNIERYNDSIRQALNLGIYGTDFIHLNIYKQHQSADAYLENINKLTKELGMNEKFQYNKIKSLLNTSKNIDSILFLTNISYDVINMEFIEKNNSCYSVLMAYGTWIESMYLATNISKVTNEEIVYQRIGEQKGVLDNLYLLVSMFDNQNEFRELLVDMKLLRSQFDKIQITYEYRTPTTQEVNGNLVIIDNSRSYINITEEQVIEISKIISAIRNKMTS